VPDVSVLRTIRTRVLAVVLGAFAAVILIGLGALTFVLLSTLRAQAGSTAQATAEWIAEEINQHPPATVIAGHADDKTSGERVIQILEGGRVIASLPADAPALTSAEGQVGQVSASTIPRIDGVDGDSFALAVTAARTVEGQIVTVAVATPSTLEESTQIALLTLATLTGVGLLALVAVGVRYAVAAALRPVEEMRAQAHSITDIGVGRRLPVPAGDDEFSRLATTLNDLLDRLQRSDSARRAFVSDAGHELRSPLASARVALDRLRDGALPEDERVAALARARLALDRLGYVVDDLLVLSRMDERTAVTPETEIDLDDVVLRAVRALPTTDERITLALEPARVVADPKLWDRLVRNLLDNADRHAHSHIRVTLRREAAGAVLEVDNDGPPVPEAERVRIFERFVRLDAARARDAGGSGLGLAIVAAVAERAGGRASAGETPEGWCRFRIEVPVAPG